MEIAHILNHDPIMASQIQNYLHPDRIREVLALRSQDCVRSPAHTKEEEQTNMLRELVVETSTRAQVLRYHREAGQ